jgi:hypothetical protein
MIQVEVQVASSSDGSNISITRYSKRLDHVLIDVAYVSY